MPSLLEAIDSKYGDDDADFEISIFVPKKSPRNCIPSLLVLNDCDIESAGDENELATKCRGVEELDLAQNKLTKWDEVFEILKHMPRVKFLNLSFNNLTSQLDAGQWRLACLRNLILNGTKIDWRSVRRLLKMLPCLEELHLSMNQYSNVELGEEKKEEEEVWGHKAVRKLHFNGNPVGCWNEVAKLGQAFPSLESLLLAECPLRELQAHHTANFPELRFLNLSSTLLDTWEDIEHLRLFPELGSLRITNCPLLEEYTEHERRQLLIGRLPNVHTLNGGGQIDAEEREDAERAFIRFYMEKPESERPSRYEELIAVHGRLEPLVNVDLSPKKRVRVLFSMGERREARVVDVNNTVWELRKSLEGWAGIPAPKMRLYYFDQVMSQIMGPEEMRFPSKKLYSYNIVSGDEIIIEAKS
ncbi:hypothetical protein B566_EDAN010703 [Ephemera danica]|nr:hypothetical protein B566_EDAN010703 [Ephemera danica]